LADKVIDLKANVASLEEQLESVADRAAAAETALNSAPAASVGGDKLRDQIAAIVYEAMRFQRDEIVPPWKGGNSLGEDRARAAAERLLTQPRPSVPASAAAVTEPLCWMCEWTDHTSFHKIKTDAEVEAGSDIVAQPLYAAPPQPRGWLTEEERGSIQHAANLAKANWSYSVAQELENILARSSPPEVVLPNKVGMSLSLPPHLYRDDEVHAALDAAGVPWKEVGRE
jgi:hypothetical protein